ncbi:MAG: glycoside hydrolase family 44 protein, partial [Bacteroidales bacterium]
LEPDKTDGVVYIDEYVHYLTEVLGEVGEGGIDGFGIDNEPALWRSTHPRIRPDRLTIDELFGKTIEVASIVKEHSPQSEVYGPMFYGWWDAQDFENIPDWSSYKFGIGYDWFVDFYLDSLAGVEQQTGQRLLDVLAVHWYPEAKGVSTQKRIVNIDGSVTDDELIADDMVEARLQAPRSLWDPTYDENGSISGKIQYINRLKNSIETYYPGTKLAFTEFKYGAEDHFSGGLALADVLGVFGREGVYLATKWDPMKSYARNAYQLYLDYDGNGSSFGSTSVRAEVTDNEVFSTVASVDDNGVLRIVAINKTDADKSTEFSLAGGYYSHASVYGFGQNNATITEFTEVDTIDGASFTYAVPAYTAVLFEVQPLQQTLLESAVVLDADPSKIVATFDSDVSVSDVSAAISESHVVIGEDTVVVTNIEEGSSTRELQFVLQNPVQALDTCITLSYAGNHITGLYSKPVHNIDNAVVKNQLSASPLVVLHAKTNQYGTAVHVEFSKKIDAEALGDNSLSVRANESLCTIDSLVFNSENPFSLVAYVSPRLVMYDSIYVESSVNPIRALDGSQTGSFSAKVVNNAPRNSPEIDSIVVADNYSMEVHFSKLIESINFLEAGINIYNNAGDTIEIEEYNFYNNILYLHLKEPVLPDSDYYLSYTSQRIKSVYGGYLEKIYDMLIDNNLSPLPSIVEIPNRVEAENYSYHRSNSQIEDNSDDDGGGEHIGFISSDNIFGYHIRVPEAGEYTLSFRHASVSATADVLIRVHDDTLGTMYIPYTGSWEKWANSAKTIYLNKGDFFIEFVFLTGGVNFNWFSLEKGSNPSSAEILHGQTNFSGELIYVEYTRKIEILPTIDELSLLYDDGTDVPLADVDFLNDNNTTMKLVLDTMIYKNQAIFLSYNDIQAITVDGAPFEPVSSYAIQNKSSQVNSAISTVYHDFKVYPIQATSGENIYITLDAPHRKMLKVTDMAGAIVIQKDFSENMYTVQLSEPGMYVVQLMCDGYVLEKKIVIY